MSKKPRTKKASEELEFLTSMGKSHHQAGRLQQAEELYRQVLARDSRHAGSLHFLGLVQYQRGQSNEALDLIGKSLKQNPRDAEAQNNMGNVLRRLGRANEAIDRFQKAVKLLPEFAGAYNNLGLTYRQLGRFEQAAEQFRLAIEYNPRLAEAWSGLARTGRLSLSPDEAAAAESIVANQKLPDNDRRHIFFALGKHFDATGDWDRAFGYYERANELGKTSENRGMASRILDGILMASVPSLDMTKDAGNAEISPIFVFGMPRSGTTLVEQILASHPDVHSCGELNAIDATLRQLHPEIGTGDAAFLSTMSPDHRSKLRDAFTSAVMSKLGDVPRPPLMITDKSLLNFAYLPILQQLFPNARFVHCQRDPHDTCLSIYFTDFKAAYDFTNDLPEIGRFYGLYHQVMEKWRRVLPCPVFDVAYEDLIDNQETTSRALLEHCGLPWESACLRFFETDRQVSTPSDWQVRLPIFSSSRGRWENYRNHISELNQHLKPYT